MELSDQLDGAPRLKQARDSVTFRLYFWERLSAPSRQAAPSEIRTVNRLISLFEASLISSDWMYTIDCVGA